MGIFVMWIFLFCIAIPFVILAIMTIIALMMRLFRYGKTSSRVFLYWLFKPVKFFFVSPLPLALRIALTMISPFMALTLFLFIQSALWVCYSPYPVSALEINKKISETGVDLCRVKIESMAFSAFDYDWSEETIGYFNRPLTESEIRALQDSPYWDYNEFDDTYQYNIRQSGMSEEYITINCAAGRLTYVRYKI